MKPSNPVVPTIFMGASDAPEAFPLSASLASALAAAADALAAVARALGAPQPPPLSPAPSHSQRECYSWNNKLAPLLVEAVNEFLTSKARAGRSDRYLRQLRVSLRSLVVGRSRVPVDQVTAADLDRWLRAGGWAARTRKGYLSDASTLFAWCQRRGWLAENPARGVDVPASVPKPPGILCPEEVAELLGDALRADPGVARVLALRFFGGLRTAESLRLVEADIRGDYVHLEADKAKTRRRRLVTINPTLRAWLSVPGGELPVSEKRVRRVLSGRELPANCARHSFCSYHLAAHGSAGRTALEAGHAESVLFAHYRELTTPEQAAAFWAIEPQAAGPAGRKWESRPRSCP